MKYTKEKLKEYGISYNVIYDDYNIRPEVIIENINGDYMRYKKDFNYISIDDYIDNAIDKFIAESRKEKLIRLNEV
jgi:hypothetical protein